MTTAYVRITRKHYTPAQIGKLIGCSRQTVIARIESGELEASRTPGGHWRIPSSVVEGVENRIPIVNADALTTGS